MHLSHHPLRFATPAQLGEALQQARTTSLSLFDGFFGSHGEALVQKASADGFNPPLWQLGHIAWFWEWFVLRDAQSTDANSAARASLLSKGDDWFDGNISPRSRWTLDLPSKGALKTYCHEVLDRCLDKLSRTPNHDAALYPFRLALAHEDLAAEQFLCSLQAHGLAAPARYSAPGAYSWAQGEIHFPGGTIRLGSGEGGFVFDNEQPPNEQRVAAFKMDSTLISNQQFAEFVEDGGYQRRQFWSEQCLRWLMQQERSAPRYWH
ncbi:MAG: SUMF1/EgtB/PvdO family nonheme iron enzyme, partial [Burkholderiales bacterium]|nr:SUMF1/EgtB/PvdO family nonheme iron enzyme [Burkholderiales bacterium]